MLRDSRLLFLRKAGVQSQLSQVLSLTFTLAGLSLIVKMETTRLELLDEEPEPQEEQEVFEIVLPPRMMMAMQVYIYYNPRILSC